MERDSGGGGVAKLLTHAVRKLCAKTEGENCVRKLKAKTVCENCVREKMSGRK